MDLRQLECFLAVVDHGGFTRAAEALGISQPGVSAQLRNLERSLGEPLFVRGGRGGVRLTAAGRAAVEPARAAVAAAGRVGRAVADLTGLLSGRLALGHVSAGAAATLVEPLAGFHAAHPQVEVSLVEDRSERLLDDLASGALDLAWVGLAGDLPAGLGGRTVVDERLVLGVAADHALASRTAVRFDDAVHHPLIAMPTGTGARAAWDAGCAQRGLAPRIAFECSSPDLIGSLAARGVGAAVLPEPLAAILGLVAVPLERPAMRSRIVLAWAGAGPVNPAARAFLATIGARSLRA